MADCSTIYILARSKAPVGHNLKNKKHFKYNGKE